MQHAIVNACDYSDGSLPKMDRALRAAFFIVDRAIKELGDLGENPDLTPYGHALLMGGSGPVAVQNRVPYVPTVERTS